MEQTLAEDFGADRRGQCIDFMSKIYVNGEDKEVNYFKGIVGYSIDGPNCIFRFEENREWNMDNFLNCALNNQDDKDTVAGIFKPFKHAEITYVKPSDIPSGFIFARGMLKHYQVSSVNNHALVPMGRNQPKPEFVVESASDNARPNTLLLQCVHNPESENVPSNRQIALWVEKWREMKAGFTRIMRMPCELDTKGELIYDLAYVFRYMRDNRPEAHWYDNRTLVQSSSFNRANNLKDAIIVVNLVTFNKHRQQRMRTSMNGWIRRAMTGMLHRARERIRNGISLKRSRVDNPIQDDKDKRRRLF